jgi:hypothetical protein
VSALAALDQALAQTSDLSRTVRGLLRIGFVLTTEGPALSRLVSVFQARYQRALAVAATHRLAAQPSASVEELAEEEVALLPSSTPSAPPSPSSTAPTWSSSPSTACLRSARPGLVHESGEPAHPRPERGRQLDGHAASGMISS